MRDLGGVFKVGYIGCAKTIDPGFGVVALVEATSYHRNDKRINKQIHIIMPSSNMSHLVIPTPAMPVSATSVASPRTLPCTLGDVFCRRAARSPPIPMEPASCLLHERDFAAVDLLADEGFVSHQQNLTCMILGCRRVDP